MTCIVGANLDGNFAIDNEAIVDEKLVSRLDGDERMNKDTITRLDRFAARRTGVVDESRAVATTATVNNASI